jgi:hypothetical protein
VLLKGLGYIIYENIPSPGRHLPGMCEIVYGIELNIIL